jgi:hypothetical protein
MGQAVCTRPVYYFRVVFAFLSASAAALFSAGVAFGSCRTLDASEATRGLVTPGCLGLFAK